MSDALFHPELIDPSVYLAAGARIVGHVTVGAESSFWFNAVARGDVERIVIGRRTNVQDNCVLHADPGVPCHVGHDVTIGHGAIVHGARVGNGSMIGMNAVVMNRAEIGENCLIAVGAVVTEGTVIPAGSLAMGIPAKVKRQLTSEEIAGLQHAADHYVANAAAFHAAERSAQPRA